MKVCIDVVRGTKKDLGDIPQKSIVPKERKVIDWKASERALYAKSSKI